MIVMVDGTLICVVFLIGQMVQEVPRTCKLRAEESTASDASRKWKFWIVHFWQNISQCCSTDKMYNPKHSNILKSNGVWGKWGEFQYSFFCGENIWTDYSVSVRRTYVLQFFEQTLWHYWVKFLDCVTVVSPSVTNFARFLKWRPPEN